ncbi:efflux RND transporter periplasmic adaptor subunit [Phyllobacterium chamaecytisi]|uniref:efflux RND transporter periplasmic adaptor subunit n=1 Tax=Phyllobacterium chamaecytisi TaxID=2876082 RepID=UPI001CC9B98E|nr:efflux RND transporter periplasmic adaptor subunit [Phyllobacterium sp. KW56]MBZ9603227.1 efflux RND transporter periplasmic adaptor subunit [Phyllobacterium sp. KW56]
MIKRMAIMLVAVGIVFGGLYGFQIFKAGMIKEVMAGLANPPQTVSTVVATKDTWQPKIEAVGAFKAVNGADLALQVSGIVKDIAFQSGDMVTAGQTLLQLVADDDAAKLDSLQATADLYALTLKRDQEQFKIRAVSQATLDTDLANLKNARSLVAQQKALVEQKTLKAPFAGRLGIRSADIGQFLSVGTTIVTLQALDPIFVDLFLPQQALSQIKVGQSVLTMIDTYPGETFAGEISAINPKVDSGSRNVQVRVTMQNPDGRLLPGMFAKVSISVGQPEPLITLAQTAIVNNPYGDSVFIVDKTSDGKLLAREAFVKTGLVRGDQIAVTEGIKEGETVVIAGQIKLHNGSPVVVDNTHVPVAEASPSIVDR